LYQGNARLWQDGNIVEAPTIQFDRDRRFLVAQGTAAQPVSTVLVQAKLGEANKSSADKAKASKPQPDRGKAGGTPALQPGKAGGAPAPRPRDDETSPIAITAARLNYSDADRLAHYEGGVIAHGASFTESSSSLDAYLRPRSQSLGNQSLTGPGQLDHMVAEGSVVIVQPTRRAVGNKLVYTASDDKFVLTGGPPSIFDAEHGKITGVSLTFFRGDDRVLVEGEASTPVVTQTRVAR
jgi:lipopolysaccharide export system protein LptA